MTRLKRQDGEPIDGNLSLHECVEWFRERLFIETGFDGDLPIRGGTHVDFILRVDDLADQRADSGSTLNLGSRRLLPEVRGPLP